MLEQAGGGVNAKLSPIQRDSVQYWRGKIRSGDTSYTARLGLGRNMAPAYVYDQSFAPQIAERLTQGNLELNSLVWQNLRQIEYDCKPQLKHFNAPVLIVQGEYDVLDPELATIAHETYPNATLLMLERCGHYGWLDRPEAYFGAIDDFLKPHVSVR